MLKIFLDANAVISGLIFGGNEVKLLSAGRLRLCNLVISEYVLKEVIAVLRSPRFKLTDDETSFLITYLLNCARLYKDPPKELIKAHYYVLRDKKDVPVLAGFLFHECDHLITGDKELLKKVEKAVTAKKALKLLSIQK
ncbi:MAG: putative toxin-antitoxin system toxin component, PIN family [Candidatus Thermoplasmatota archaeon]